MRILPVKGSRPGRAKWAERGLWFSAFEDMARALVAGEPFEAMLSEAKAKVVAALDGAGFHLDSWAPPKSGSPCLRLTNIFKRCESLMFSDQLSGEVFELSVDFTLAQSGPHCGLQLDVDIWSAPHASHITKTVLVSAVWESPPAPTLTATYLESQMRVRNAKLPSTGVFEAMAAAVVVTLVPAAPVGQ